MLRGVTVEMTRLQAIVQKVEARCARGVGRDRMLAPVSFRTTSERITNDRRSCRIPFEDQQTRHNAFARIGVGFNRKLRTLDWRGCVAGPLCWLVQQGRGSARCTDGKVAGPTRVPASSMA